MSKRARVYSALLVSLGGVWGLGYLMAVAVNGRGDPGPNPVLYALLVLAVSAPPAAYVGRFVHAASSEPAGPVPAPR